MAISSRLPSDLYREKLMANSCGDGSVQQAPSVPSSENAMKGVSRRAMLKQLAAMGAGAALSIRPLLAGMPRVDSTPQRGRIDVHHHMLPPFYMDLRRAVPDVGKMPA